MSIDPTKLSALLARVNLTSAIKEQPFVAEYLVIEWGNGAHTKYYASTAYSQISPFRDVKKYTGGNDIEPRIMGDPFRSFEINSDLRTENIAIQFDDVDGAMKANFKAYGAARCELFLYYPQVDLCTSVWWGQVLPPQVVGRFTQQTVLTNGYRSKERFLPNSITPKTCRFTYGGLLSTADQIATNGCPSDIHIGGSQGIVNPATGTFFIDCPKDAAACLARFGHKRFYGGTELDVPSYQSDAHVGNLAFSKGSDTARNKPVTWIFGTKHFKGSELLIYTRRPNQNHPEQGWIDALSRVGEGPINAINNVKVNGLAVNTSPSFFATRLGARGQTGQYPGAPITEYFFSSTALVFYEYGNINPSTVTSASLTMECDMTGYDLVAVYTDATTFTRHWSDDTVWCLLEMYTNQKCGLGYAPSRFWIEDFLAASAWTRKYSTFTLTTADNEVKTFGHRRTTFGAALEGRPAVEQLADVCRSARLSLPFQNNGKYSIAAMSAFTSGQLAAAPVFYDSGPNINLIFDGETAVKFEQIQPDKLTNEISLTFEEGNNFDIPRPIVGNDPDAQAAAAAILGLQSFNVIPKQFTAFGVRSEEEAVTLLYYLLWFNEFDAPEGGTKNNCTATLRCPFEWTLGMKRYDPMRLALTTMDIPTGPTGTSQVTTATAVGTATSSSNITVTITAAGMTGTPIALTVAILNGDTAAVWAAKVKTAMLANANITAFFNISLIGTLIRLTAKKHAANDATMNIAIAAGSTGITAAPTSAATTAGIADGPFEWFRVLSIKKIGGSQSGGMGNLAEVRGIAYNKVAYEAFETETSIGTGVCTIDANCSEANGYPPGFICVGGVCVPSGGGGGGVCSIDAECPPGFVCRGGVCVPSGDGGLCLPAITATYDDTNGLLNVAIDPCP